MPSIEQGTQQFHAHDGPLRHGGRLPGRYHRVEGNGQRRPAHRRCGGNGLADPVRGEVGRRDELQQSAGAGRADPVVQAKQPVPRHLVHPIDGDPQRRNEILDVSGFQKFEAAELHERDAPGRQFDLQQVTVVPRPHQHGLVPEQPTVGGLFQHRIGHRPSLRRRIVTADQGRPGAAGPRRVQAQSMVGGALWPDGVGEIQQRLPGPEVLFQRHHRHVLEGSGDIEQVGTVGTAEAVDGLGVVAHHGQSCPGRPQHADDVDLGLIDVLVLVDQDVVPSRCNAGTHFRVGQQ